MSRILAGFGIFVDDNALGCLELDVVIGFGGIHAAVLAHIGSAQVEPQNIGFFHFQGVQEKSSSASL